MISRRTALLAGGTLLAANAARAQSARWSEWTGLYTGTVRFHRSIPLEDIVPPPKEPTVDQDDRTPFGLQFAVRTIEGAAVLWLRVDGGPMQTSEHGETLRFTSVVDGVALLASAEAQPAPRSATLTVQPNQLGTDALFSHAAGNFWRRHFNATFTPAGADVILWVFDASGTRARTWRGSTVRAPG